MTMRRLLAIVALFGAWLVSGASYAAEAACWQKDTPFIVRTNLEGFVVVWGCRRQYDWVITGFVGRWSELAPTEVTNAAFGKLMSDSTDAEKLAAWRKYISSDWDAPEYASLQPLKQSAMDALGLKNPAYRVKDNALSATRPVFAFDATKRLTTAVKNERIADDASCNCAAVAFAEAGALYCAVTTVRVALCVPR
jgi:hypothetical protein